MSKRKVIFYKDYFNDFFNQLDGKTKKKVLQVLSWVQSIDIIPVSIMRKIVGVDDLYEIRIEFQSNIYRIFCCLDEGSLVVLFNGFQKKSQKTPSGEIDRATRIMKEYFDSKG